MKPTPPPTDHRPWEWRTALCHPDERQGPGCQPRILQRLLYKDMEQARQGNFQSYAGSQKAGACWECDWQGEPTQDENQAVEDALDHAFPGWRELPVLDEVHNGLLSDLENSRRKARIIRQVHHLFPPDWHERCGPTMHHREPGAGRHVPGHGLFGGYSVARLRQPKEHTEEAPIDQPAGTPTQQALL